MNSILGMTYPEFLEHFIRITGKKDYYARPIYKAIMSRGISNLEQIDLLNSFPDLKEKISVFFRVNLLSLEKEYIAEETKKYIFKTGDGDKIESVVVPMKTYKTLCLSSQIGCTRKCVFCETGSRGFIRNLSAGEIVSQLYYIRYVLKEPVRNIVFMGMGEPLDNYEAVIQAIRVFTERFGFNFSMPHITISTAGIIPKIFELRALNWKKLRLSVSVNACTDGLRSFLMPLNKEWPLPDLKKCLEEYPLQHNGVILLGYVLIRGVNDSLEAADQLVDFCRGLKVRVNLIPYNPGSFSIFRTPEEFDYDNFYRYLIQKKIHVIMRRTKGSSIMAGCGQLGNSL
jgi:23S rRNA (adenine2503-C2)-methyltransferase